MTEKVIKYLYFSIGFISTILGIIGLFVPLMPTTCFLIAAVWAFSKSYPQFSQKILAHPTFGPPIQNWMENKTIDRKLKCTISTSIVLGFSITFLIMMPSIKVSMLLIFIMFSLLCYINTRPENNDTQNQNISISAS
ncbi:MAG: YbaN family protein [Gammaproteobacteria bacterium]|jgi:uncharacterized membrane protein YbaN (DUF454 family)